VSVLAGMSSGSTKLSPLALACFLSFVIAVSCYCGVAIMKLGIRLAVFAIVLIK